MPLIKVNDIDIYYEQYGSGDDLVLVAGLSSDITAWGSILDDLSKSFKVTIFDNRGVGRSSQPDGEYTIEQMAVDCIALVNKLGIESACFVGHSLGGQIVQEIAATHSKYVKKAVIVTSTYHYPQYAQMHFQNIATLQTASLNGDAILRVIFPWIFSSNYLASEETIQATIQAFQSSGYPQSYSGYCGQIAALREYNSLNKLATINMPVLLITADEDLLIPKEHTQCLLQSIPNVYHASIAGCGHVPQIEASERLSALIVNFLG